MDGSGPAPRGDPVGAARQPRRLAFGRGPLPEGSELELLSGPLEEELARLAAEGVQSLLLEGGPMLASSFLDAGLVDKLLVYVAPAIAGDGPTRGLASIGTDGLGTEGTEAVGELLEEVERAGPGQRGGLEVAVRETLEAVALGF